MFSEQSFQSFKKNPLKDLIKGRNYSSEGHYFGIVIFKEKKFEFSDRELPIPVTEFMLIVKVTIGEAMIV